jgi:hypothetical protein
MGTMTALVARAKAMAKAIENRAAAVGMAYSAAQDAYGVYVEQAAFRVRFVDCDGNRSLWLWSEQEVEAEAQEWLARCVSDVPVA